jgi:cysteine desulfurase
MKKFVYFDNNATTMIAPEVLDAMKPFFNDHWGNPSSAYQFGSRLNKWIVNAREQVSDFIGARPEEVIFTSCGTESNNAAINSALLTNPLKRHIVTTKVEHSAVLRYCQELEARGYEVSYLNVDNAGRLDLEEVDRTIRPDTAIVSIMMANNETGVVFPVAKISEICKKKGVLFHTDAVQAAGKLPINVKELGVDFLSLSAHKIYAPKGIGLLYIRDGVKFKPLIIGGHQENGRRAGTENVPYIIGFGKAAELAKQRLKEEVSRVKFLRDRFEKSILELIPFTHINGFEAERLPNTTNIAFEYVESEAVIMLLDQVGVCASSGSACTTGSSDPSHVLMAMGLDPVRARGSVRFSFGFYNNESEVDYVVEQLQQIIQKLRAMSPLTPGNVKAS